jgi:AcrR family transcriptional regulator
METNSSVNSFKNSSVKAFENSKDKILKIAMKLFAKKGFDGVSIREICKEAGVNLCMISYYFGGKKELYQAIIDNLIEKQIEYSKSFIDYDMDLSSKSKEELVDFLHLIIDKMVDFMFATVSKELLAFLIAEQQKQNAIVNPPALIFVRKILAQILNKNENDREIIFKVLFLIGNVITPRVLLHFSLTVLNQEGFIKEDVELIKKNAHMYIDTIIKEEDKEK